MSGVIRFLFKVMRGCSPRRQSLNGAGKNGFRQKWLIPISVSSFILGAVPGIPLTVVGAGTPTPAPGAPVITPANAGNLKQIDRLGGGIPGGDLTLLPRRHDAGGEQFAGHLAV